MTRPLGGKNMKTDALRLPFLLNTIVTSPSSPPPSSSSLALHVSTTTHHWGQAPLDNGSFHHPQDWFNLYCNRCGTTTSPKSYLLRSMKNVPISCRQCRSAHHPNNTTSMHPRPQQVHRHVPRHPHSHRTPCEPDFGPPRGGLIGLIWS